MAAPSASAEAREIRDITGIVDKNNALLSKLSALVGGIKSAPVETVPKTLAEKTMVAERKFTGTSTIKGSPDYTRAIKLETDSMKLQRKLYQSKLIRPFINSYWALANLKIVGAFKNAYSQFSGYIAGKFNEFMGEFSVFVDMFKNGLQFLWDTVKGVGDIIYKFTLQPVIAFMFSTKTKGLTEGKKQTKWYKRIINAMSKKKEGEGETKTPRKKKSEESSWLSNLLKLLGIAGIPGLGLLGQLGQLALLGMAAYLLGPGGLAMVLGARMLAKLYPIKYTGVGSDGLKRQFTKVISHGKDLWMGLKNMGRDIPIGIKIYAQGAKKYGSDLWEGTKGITQRKWSDTKLSAGLYWGNAKDFTKGVRDELLAKVGKGIKGKKDVKGSLYAKYARQKGIVTHRATKSGESLTESQKVYRAIKGVVSDEVALKVKNFWSSHPKLEHKIQNYAMTARFVIGDALAKAKSIIDDANKIKTKTIWKWNEATERVTRVSDWISNTYKAVDKWVIDNSTRIIEAVKKGFTFVVDKGKLVLRRAAAVAGVALQNIRTAASTAAATMKAIGGATATGVMAAGAVFSYNSYMSEIDGDDNAKDLSPSTKQAYAGFRAGIDASVAILASRLGPLAGVLSVLAMQWFMEGNKYAYMEFADHMVRYKDILDKKYVDLTNWIKKSITTKINSIGGNIELNYESTPQALYQKWDKTPTKSLSYAQQAARTSRGYDSKIARYIAGNTSSTYDNSTGKGGVYYGFAMTAEMFKDAGYSSIHNVAKNEEYQWEAFKNWIEQAQKALSKKKFPGNAAAQWNNDNNIILMWAMGLSIGDSISILFNLYHGQMYNLNIRAGQRVRACGGNSDMLSIKKYLQTKGFKDEHGVSLIEKAMESIKLGSGDLSMIDIPDIQKPDIGSFSDGIKNKTKGIFDTIFDFLSPTGGFVEQIFGSDIIGAVDTNNIVSSLFEETGKAEVVKIPGPVNIITEPKKPSFNFLQSNRSQSLYHVNPQQLPTLLEGMLYGN